MIYKIGICLDEKEIGKYPQVVGAIGETNDIFKGHEGNYKPPKYEGNAIFPKVLIHKKARATDYLDNSDNIKMCVSTNFYEFLKLFIGTHQVWDLLVSNESYKFDRRKLEYVDKTNYQKLYYNYKILHISYPSINIIDMNKSEFFIEDREKYLTKISGNKLSKNYFLDPLHKSIKFESHDDLLKLKQVLKKDKNSDKLLLPKKLVFDLEQCEGLFRVFTPLNNYSGYYITENLKDKIENIGFTGMVFTPIVDINPLYNIKCNNSLS